MLAFEVSINGEERFIAGIADWDLIHADIMAKRGPVPAEDEVELSIDGLCQQTEASKHEHVRWGRRVLAVGDQVCIRIVASDAAAPPIRRYRSDRTVQEQPFTDEELLQMQRETYLQLKKKFEGVDG